jgi:hypothetical protein
MDLCRLWRQAGGDARPTYRCKNVGKFVHLIALVPVEAGLASRHNDVIMSRLLGHLRGAGPGGRRVTTVLQTAFRALCRYLRAQFVAEQTLIHGCAVSRKFVRTSIQMVRVVNFVGGEVELANAPHQASRR